MTAATHESQLILASLPRPAEPVRTSEKEFDDASLELRRLFSEAWGTFLLVVVAAGGGVFGATSYGGALTLPMKALAPGMMVMGVIFFMGTVSGAHLNPAVTLAFAVRGNFPWRRVRRSQDQLFGLGPIARHSTSLRSDGLLVPPREPPK